VRRICLSNNAAERALRGVALGRADWTFAGSDAGGHRAAAVYTLIETCKLNDVDPQAWLAYVLANLPDDPAKRIDELLPWNWKPSHKQSKPAEAAKFLPVAAQRHACDLGQMDTKHRPIRGYTPVRLNLR
jgi:transposase